nr:MAG TPA: Proteasome subunit beta type-1 [Caudoviricetes sp.]
MDPSEPNFAKSRRKNGNAVLLLPKRSSLLSMDRRLASYTVGGQVPAQCEPYSHHRERLVLHCIPSGSIGGDGLHTAVSFRWILHLAPSFGVCAHFTTRSVLYSLFIISRLSLQMKK